ncbi:hypothetical protein FGG08_003496 [Glutinoglossum americanum]|uniref:FHA domain-containing protein n=1 Tax=Glutinoglossum americanum TaxID=1670608 RepID=A0A9P8L0I8_9PEZI|nr:hypothetical protein FGG08_003496 [Glutinoglossum americanum]
MSAIVTKQATVTLFPLNFPADPSPRILKLTPSTSAVRIGRASKSASKGLQPSPNNAWFDSPAISLTDIGSMHGTKIDNRQLKKQDMQKITSDQIVTFGSEVARGKDIFPPRQFKVHIDWDDWSPPTPISSSPLTNSPNRGYGIADEDLMISSDDGMSDSGSSVDKHPLNPPQMSPSPQPQTTAPVANVSTFMVPDSEPSSPLTSGYGRHEGTRIHTQANEVDSQEVQQAGHSRNTISCPVELVDIEFSGPTGLTEQEKAEDEGLFLTRSSVEREFNRGCSAGENTSSSSKRQAKDITVIDLDEVTGNAKNPVIIEDTPAREIIGVGKQNDSRPPSYSRSDCVATGQEPREDEEYSPPPASAYGNESSVGSDHDMDIPTYSSDEDGSGENFDDEVVSEDEFDNEGWSRPVSDHEQSVFDYYDEASEAEDTESDGDNDEESSQPGPEPSKLSVMTEAMKTIEETTIEDTNNLATPPTAPVILVEDSQISVANNPGLSTRTFTHHNIQYRGTNCSLPPIQKMKVSEAVSPIYFPPEPNSTARAPSPSDAAMVKTSSIQTNPNVGPFPKERSSEFPPRSSGILCEVHEAIEKGAHFSNGNRNDPMTVFSRTDDVDMPESLRADNARKLGELSGKSEFFQAREANRKEAFSNEPRKPTVPQPTRTTTSFPSTSDLDYVFSFEPGTFDFEPQDTCSQKPSREFRDFASTASEAGSFGATDELSSPPYMTDGARQGEFRDAGFPIAMSAAGLKKDFENWMKRDMDISSQCEAEMARPPQDMRENLGGPQESQEPISSSRVSIRNIVDPVEEVPPSKPEMPRHSVSCYVGIKRKADEISSLDLDNVHNSEPSQEQSQPLIFEDSLMADAQPREQDVLAPPEELVSFDSSSQFENTQATHADEPASKRVKVTTEPRRGGIARFAATALAGAVIGGIGVFAALVASAPSA